MKKYLWVILLLVVPSIVQGAACTQYVSNSGSASWSNASNIATPTSPATALANAVADNVVCFRGGSYNAGVSPTDSEQNSWQPANSGTSGHPITFRAYPGETPVVTGTWQSSAYNLAQVFGIYGKNYIVIDGFTIYGTDGTNPVCGSMRIYDTTGSVVKNCTVRGIDTGSWTDNVEGIRIERDTQTTISNNYIYNFSNASLNHNTSGIKMYDDTYITVENNNIIDCTNGIYVKRQVSDSIFRYNFIKGTYDGIFDNPGSSTYSMYRNKYYHNLIVGCQNALWVLVEDVYVADNYEVYNNTVYYASGSGSDTAILAGNGTGWKIYNNIIQGFGTGRKLLWYPSTSVTECDYNQYGTGTFNVVTNLYGGGGTRTYTSLANWHASTEVTGSVHPEGASSLNGLASDPLFVNTSGNLNQIADFALQGGSPSKGTGKAGADMGADVTLVGVSGGGQQPPADTTAPVVTAFIIPDTATTLLVAITTFTCTDAVGVTGYLANESASAPTAGDAGWVASAQTSYTFASQGAKTLYGWCKDAAGNISSSLNDSVTITLPQCLIPWIH